MANSALTFEFIVMSKNEDYSFMPKFSAQQDFVFVLQGVGMGEWWEITQLPGKIQADSIVEVYSLMNSCSRFIFVVVTERNWK
jgi:hypothetical protein